jgi:sterol desaturase/sphingolipid hydroxylase (fatty acid hydroxylase superfamily)
LPRLAFIAGVTRGEGEARDKNFAGLHPVWDILFETYYMQRDKYPSRFGTDTQVPKALSGQLIFPFRHPL